MAKLPTDQLLAIVQTLLPTNHNQEIEALDVRTVFTDVVDTLTQENIVPVNSTPFTVADDARGNLLVVNRAASTAITLPQPSSGGFFVAGWSVAVLSIGAGTVTITPTASTINGAANILLTQNQGLLIATDGLNYFAIKTNATGGGGSGDVIGPASAVDNTIVLFDGVTGKLIKQATGSGVVISTSGVISFKTNPTGAFVGTTDSQTLSGKTINLNANTLTGTVAEFNTALQGADFYTTGGTDVALADGGTGRSLVDPNADRIIFWDDSAGQVDWLTPGTGLSITGTTINSLGGDVVGPASSVDNQIVLFNGTTGKLVKVASGTGVVTATSGVYGTVATVGLAQGGTGASLVDPNADRIVFWDDSAGAVDWLTVGSGLNITGTTLTATGGGSGDVVGPASVVDGQITLFDGATGKLIKAATGSGVVIATSGVYSTSAQLALAAGGTGSNLVDPNADRILFWDDSAGLVDWLSLGTNLSITGTTLNATGGSGGGDVSGPGASVVGEIVLWNNTLGTLVSRATGTGFVAVSSGVYGTPRTVTGTANQITVTNGDGSAGNPTISLPADVLIPTVLTVPNTGLHLLDTNASHDLIIAPGSDLTADRTLTVTTGDASRTLTLSGNLTVSSNSTIAGTAYVQGGTDVALADGGTGASLVDPNADRIVFWDDSAGAVDWLAPGAALAITATTIAVNLSATSRILGRITAGAGDAEELTGANVRTITGLATTDSPQFTGIELGNVSDTTLTRASAGNVNIEGNLVYRADGTDVPVADGGTGVSSLTAYAVICGGTTSTGAVQSIASVGTAGQVLTSNGAGALPTFQAAGGGGWTNVMKTSDTSRSSTTTVTADPALQFSMAASTNYVIRIVCKIQTPAAADWKYSLTGPASPTEVFGGIFNSISGSVEDNFNAYPANQGIIGANVVGGLVVFELTVRNGANPGPFSIDWAQNTSNATATIMKAGSYLEYRTY